VREVAVSVDVCQMSNDDDQVMGDAEVKRRVQAQQAAAPSM
jgi:hypothetical protein